MQRLEQLEQLSSTPGPVHLALGIFDGVHRGHQAVIAAALASARRSGGRGGVLTFQPHPSAVLRPTEPVRLLQTPTTKRHALAALGVDFVVEHPFTPAFAQLTPTAFVAWLKKTVPTLASVHTGENFRFGADRAGDAMLLATEATRHGFTGHSVPRLQSAGEAISSSRLRALIAAGEMESARGLLGYAYFSLGTVQPGRRLGRTLGFPTLNLPWAPSLMPRFGVYAVTFCTPDGRTGLGVANYGVRPTVEGAGQPLLEVHALNDPDLRPGAEMAVRWLHFLRPEQKFANHDALRAQIVQDRENAQKYLVSLENPLAEATQIGPSPPAFPTQPKDA